MGGFNTTPTKDEGSLDGYPNDYKGADFGKFPNKEGNKPAMKDNDSFSSEEEADRFKAAAQANAMRMSEKKVHSKLANESKKTRKTTIDFENLLKKGKDEEPKTHNHTIKKGYYAKLGIERSPTMNCSYNHRHPLVPSTLVERQQRNDRMSLEFTNTHKKSLSTKNLMDGLEVDDLAPKRFNSDINEDKDLSSKDEETKDILESPELEDTKEEQPTAARLQKSYTITEGAKLDASDASEFIETSYTTKDSGNWRLDLVKNTGMARTADRIRRDLLSKLTYQKIWLTPAEKPGTHQTVFIYDWDDTLLCTSFLNPTGYYDESLEIPEMAKKHLEKLEKAVEKVLRASIKLGKTYIVTNAAEGWVQFSSKKYMPGVYEALKKVEVISARSLFEKLYPGDSYEWKIQAFTNIQKELESSMVTNIIACGDSRIEMDAARHIAKLFQTAFIKTVKFKEAPTPEELIKQLNLVIQKLDHISSAPRNLTIRLERKNK